MKAGTWLYFTNTDTRPRLQSRMQKNMFCYLDFRCYFETNGQNHIHFRLIQVLKNSIAWHFLTYTSPSSKVEFVYLRVAESKNKCSSPRQVLTPGRVKGSWNPIPKLTIVLIWKTPGCLKFGKTSNRESEQRTMPTLSAKNFTELPCDFIWVVRGAMHSG